MCELWIFATTIHMRLLISWTISVYAIIEDKRNHSVKNSVCWILHIAISKTSTRVTNRWLKTNEPAHCDFFYHDLLVEFIYRSKTFYISQQTSMTILLGINCVDRTVSSLPGIEQIQLGPVLDSCHLFIKWL